MHQECFQKMINHGFAHCCICDQDYNGFWLQRQPPISKEEKAALKHFSHVRRMKRQENRRKYCIWANVMFPKIVCFLRDNDMKSTDFYVSLKTICDNENSFKQHLIFKGMNEKATENHMTSAHTILKEWNTLSFDLIDDLTFKYQRYCFDYMRQ